MMPLHDWTKVPAGLFHDFHQTWSIFIKNKLNDGILPKGLSALVEPRSGPKESDVLAIESYGNRRQAPENGAGGLLVAERPTAQMTYHTDKEIYASRANRIVVKHHLGRTVAVIELLSPGNKDSRAAIRDFVNKTIDYLRAGIHVLIVDLFPPTSRDPLGMHQLIWDEIADDAFAFPTGKDRLIASYEVGPRKAAYVETVGVGDLLPNVALFVTEGMHVKVPLEATYVATWEASPAEFRRAVETGVLPNPDADEERI